MTNLPYDSLISTQEHWKQMNIPDNFDVFRDVAYGLSAFVIKGDSGGLVMNGFGHCREEIEVE